MKKVPLGRAVARVTPPMVICLLGAGGVAAAAQLSTGKLPSPAVPAVHFPAPPSTFGSGPHGHDTAPTTAATPGASSSTTSTIVGSRPPQPAVTWTSGTAPASTLPSRTTPGTSGGGREPGDDSGPDSPATTVVPNYPVVTDSGTTIPSPSTTTQARDS